MKKLNTITIIAVFLSVAATSYTLVFNKYVNSHLVFPANEENSISASYVYTIGEHNGFLAVFEDDDKNPVKIYDTPVSVLPESDREMLKEGITVQTESQLQKMIEDYTS